MAEHQTFNNLANLQCTNTNAIHNFGSHRDSISAGSSPFSDTSGLLLQNCAGILVALDPSSCIFGCE